MDRAVETTRFAPSPTGWLHRGHAYAALVAHARAGGGRFLLRFEDIDKERVREPFYAGIEEDLRWLGLEWEPEVMRQKDRGEAYAAALDALRRLEVVYPCFCTRKEIREEISRMGRAPHGPEGPLYPGTCRGMSAAERDERMARGEAFSWRLDVGKAEAVTGRLSWVDARKGEVECRAAELGDVVLARKDVGTSYHLAVVVDDAAQGVTLVTRGEDLFASTHVHRLLQALLGLPVPRWEHHPLVVDAAGKRLAKRDEAETLRVLRAMGHGVSQLCAGLPPV